MGYKLPRTTAGVTNLMTDTRRRPGRPRLTVLGSNGTMRSAPVPRRRSPAPIDDLPTRVYFSRGSSTPTGKSLSVLHKYAQWLARNRARYLSIVGHANHRSWAKSAKSLADARVRAVRDLLIWLGAERKQVRRMSRSRLHSVKRASTRAERAEHRFVELIVGPTGQSNVTASVPRRRTPTHRRAA